jgi:polyhydroxyalkanoate synthesis regulator phasin
VTKSRNSSVKSTKSVRRKPAPRRAAPRPRVSAPAAVAGRKLWLAGLGAAASALEGAAGVFDALVAKGRAHEPQAKAIASRVLKEARAKADDLGELAVDAAASGKRRLNRALDRIGAAGAARPKNLLHRLGDLAEAIL